MDQIIQQQRAQQNFASLQSQFFKKDSFDSSKTAKSYSPQLRRRHFRDQGFRTRFMSPQPVQQTISEVKAKQNFDSLFKKIQKITSKENFGAGDKIERRFKIYPSQQIQKITSTCHRMDACQPTDPKSKVNKSKSIISPRIQKALAVQRLVPADKRSLEIRNVVENIQSNKEPCVQMLMRRSRYKAKLQPIRKASLSNNVRDYLSVQKISLRDIQDLISPKLKDPVSLHHSGKSNLLQVNQNKCIIKELLPVVKLNPPRKKFTPPFDTYHYRDLVWRSGYSNGTIVEVPSEYPFKVKVYIGKGNNSRLIRGIICRRAWYQVTDRIEEANFAWTQIKSSNYMTLQKPSDITDELDKMAIDYVPQSSVLTLQEQGKYQAYWKEHMASQLKSKQDLAFRNKHFKIKPIRLIQMQKVRIHNHFKNNFIIGNKKALFQTMSSYYKSTLENIFDYLPLTFHIKNGLEDDQYLHFLKFYYQQSKKTKKQQPAKVKSYNIWIVKPGQNTNQGNGIVVCLTLEEVKNILKKKEKHFDGSYKTHIVQKYIERPLLYKKRKFDLRHYIVIGCMNGITKGYWCKEGYVRTTSAEYSLKLGSSNVHLTNDAVQKHLPDYGKYEKGNKISYEDLHTYLKKCNYRVDFWKDIYSKMKKIATDAIRASGNSMDPDKKTNFQLFGLDFMIDDNFDVWLIEINTNPCLETSNPVLMRTIPKVIQNSFELFLDPIFPAPKEFNPKSPVFYKNLVQQNCFELVYDEREQNPNKVIQTELKIDKKLQQQQQDTFEDDGQDWTDD